LYVVEINIKESQLIIKMEIGEDKALKKFFRKANKTRIINRRKSSSRTGVAKLDRVIREILGKTRTKAM